MAQASAIGALRAPNEDLDRRFVGAICARDIEQAMSCFWNSPDLIVVHFDGTVMRGWDAVKASMQQLFSQFESIRFGIDEITHVPLGDGVAAVGTATFRLQARDGSVQELTERWTDVRRLVDGRWVYVLDHAHALGTPPGGG